MHGSRAWDRRKKLLLAVVCACALSNVVIVNMAWGRRQADRFNDRVLLETEIGSRKLAEAGIVNTGAQISALLAA